MSLSSGSSTKLRPNATTVHQPMHAASLFQDGEPIPGWSAPMTTSGLQNERWGAVRANASEERAVVECPGQAGHLSGRQRRCELRHVPQKRA